MKGREDGKKDSQGRRRSNEARGQRCHLEGVNKGFKDWEKARVGTVKAESEEEGRRRRDRRGFPSDHTGSPRNRPRAQQRNRNASDSGES